MSNGKSDRSLTPTAISAVAGADTTPAPPPPFKAAVIGYAVRDKPEGRLLAKGWQVRGAKRWLEPGETWPPITYDKMVQALDAAKLVMGVVCPVEIGPG